MLRVVVLRNTIAQILTRLISASGTLLVALVVARQFGATGFGELTKIFLAVGVFYLVLDAGLNAIFVAEANTNPLVQRQQFSSFLFARMVWSLVLIGIVLVLFVVSPTPPFPISTLGQQGIVIASLTLFAQGILVSCNALFQLRLHYHCATIAQIAGSLTTILLLGLVVWLVPARNPTLLLWIVGVLMSGSLVAAAVSLWFARTALVLRVQWQFVRRLLAKGWIFGATLVVIAINDQMGRLVLSRCCTTAEVGIYGLAYKVFEFPLAIPTFFVNSIFPILVFERRQGKQLASRIGKSALFLIVSSVVVGVGFFMVSPLLPLIKSDFAASIIPFRILLVSLPLFFLTALSMWTLVLYEKRTTLFAIYTTVLLCNAGIGMVVIPRFGGFGAAMMVAVSEGLVCILTGIAAFVYARKKHN